MIEGGDYPKIIWDALDLVTGVDGMLMGQAVPDGIMVLTVPTAEPQELMLPGPPPG